MMIYVKMQNISLQLEIYYRLLYSNIYDVKNYSEEAIEKHKLQLIHDYIIDIPNSSEPANIIKKLSELIQFDHPWFQYYYEFQLAIYNNDSANPILDVTYIINNRKFALRNSKHFVFLPISCTNIALLHFI